MAQALGVPRGDSDFPELMDQSAGAPSGIIYCSGVIRGDSGRRGIYVVEDDGDGGHEAIKEQLFLFKF